MGNRVATGSAGAYGFLLGDLHGNTAGALNSACTAITDAFAYDAYGNTVAAVTSGLPTPWRFQGRILESAGNSPDLYDFGARSYSPTIGAFTSLDSMGGSAQNTALLNGYLYANGNPATLVDPDGHCAAVDNYSGCESGGAKDFQSQLTSSAWAKASRNDMSSAAYDANMKYAHAVNSERISNAWDQAGSGNTMSNAAYDANLWQMNYLAAERYAWISAAQNSVVPDCRAMSEKACQNVWIENVTEKVSQACYADPESMSCRLYQDLNPDMADGWRSVAHLGLAVCSLGTVVPTGVGQVAGVGCSLANAGLYASEGDPLNAFLAALPAGFTSLKAFRAATAADGAVAADAAAGSSTWLTKAGEACGLSFTPDTQVATESGSTAIGLLRVGDTVIAYDPTTGETGPHTVTAVMTNLDPVVEHLKLDSGPIETTPNHPFFTVDRGWVEAGDLIVGEQIRTESGQNATVVSFTTEATPSTMWDITVDGAHSFFVGDGAVLVHNAGPCLGNKLDYLFGKASGSTHNIERSQVMASQLSQIGIGDTAAGRQIIVDHLAEVAANPSNIVSVAGSRVVRESLLAGPGGFLKVESIWDGNSLITVILKG